MTALPVIRTSERRDLKRCPQRWHWAWREGLRPWRTSNPLWFGQGIHLALAEWYQLGRKRGPHPVETWEKFVSDEDRYIPVDYEDDEYKYMEAKALGIEMLNGYIDTYGKDESWSVIATEQTFQLPIELRKKPIATYVGTFDGVYRDLTSNEIWLMEHKTAKAIFTNHLPLDDQASAYFAFATWTLREQGLIKKDEHLEGVMYNFLRKSPADTRPVNAEGLRTNKPSKAHYIAALAEADLSLSERASLSKKTLPELESISTYHALTVIGEVSKNQPLPNFLREPVWRSRGEERGIMRGIRNEIAVMQAYKRRELPLFKNPSRDCSWDCSFFRMCMLHEANEDWEEYKEAEFHTEDPYADHRENRKSAQ